MKATLSRDGVMRFTVRIDKRVDAMELINALGFAWVHDGNGQSKLPHAQAVEAFFRQYRSRGALVKLLKNHLSHEGATLWTWSDGMLDKECSVVREQARVLVSKVFPELKRKEAL